VRKTAQWLMLAVTLLAVIAASPTAMARDTEEMISSAQTRADHEALAVHYEQEAEAQRQKEEQHRRIRTAYEQGGVYKAIKEGMIQHCNLLIRKYHELVEVNLEMAKMHRQLAAAAPQ